MASKPKLTLRAAVLLYEIAAYARRYGTHGDILRNAASDVMDGLVCNSDQEVKELIRKKIIERVGPTWELTAEYQRIWKKGFKCN